MNNLLNHKSSEATAQTSEQTVKSETPDVKALEHKIACLEQELFARKKREKQLRKKESFYRMYFRESLAGSYISTPGGRLVLCNKEFLNIFGFKTMDQALKEPMDNLFIRSEDRNEFIGVLKKQKRVTRYNQKLKTLDGKTIHLIENSFAVFDKKGRFEYLQGFLLDVTLLKQLEKQLHEAQKMEAIGTLAGGIAHDFNNILSGIFGNAQLAERRLDSPEKAKANIRQIVTGAQRASELVQQILTFSKQTEYKKRYLCLEEAINEVAKFIRSTIPASIEIRKDIRPTGKILADPVQMHRLLMNLCINAFHAMQDNSRGVLDISLEEICLDNTSRPDYPPGNYLKLKISDTGHGISKDNMDRIFEPYFTTNIHGGGTGLGLASVRSIIEEHGGYIKVNSILGKGSEFYIYLPVKLHETPMDPNKKSEKPVKGSGSIMLVDDETTICSAMGQVLEEFGFAVRTFENGRQALEAFCENPNGFDLIITDLNMPKMRGDQFIIEALKVRKDIPAILCTGHCDGFNKKDALDLGACMYLEKPLEMHGLVTAVNEVLGQAHK